MELQVSDLTSRIHKDSLLEKIKSEETNFHKLLQWSLLDEQPLAWRATWLLRQITAKNDSRIALVISEVIAGYPGFNHSQRREWLKLLSNQNFTEEQEGELYDLCLSEWKNIANQPALRASAIDLLFTILKKYPELTNELAHLMTSDYLDALSPGIKKGVVKQWNHFSA